MTDARRNPRTVLVPDHLWNVFAQMAAEMGSDRDGLVNQALFAFARSNGYLAPGALRPAAPPDDAAAGDAPGQRAGSPPEETPPDDSPPEARGAKRPRRSAAAPATGAAAASAPGATLILLSDGREVDRIVKSRFVIGRGKHCDLVIHSGKVSREHAAITREGGAWFIEDLGSSNGTWFDQRRITRRQIREGDEYFISAERLSCAFR
ncbi:MAG: hypothetical protein NVSMB23_30010 [Myxococcales bacterium]